VTAPTPHDGECGPAPTTVAECERHVLCDCAEDDDRVTAPSPDPQWPRRVGERHAELLRQVADLTAERYALRRKVDAVKALHQPPADLAKEAESHGITGISCPDCGQPWPCPSYTALAGSHRPAQAPENAQEPRTPAPRSPDTPETLSGPLSAPDRDTA
jgi:hypothetical protein